MNSKVMKCKGLNCDNKYQDKRYGRNKRVHTALSIDNRRDWRCTVCGTERE